MPVEWYRTTDHGEDAKAEFSRRYGRARHPHRIQYKQVKAVCLMEAGELEGIRWAQDLLTEITADQDAYRYQRASAFELLAEACRKAGQWKLAVQALEQCIRYLAATARARRALGQDPAPPARRALDLLEDDKPAFPRHPDVGRVHASAQTVRELHDLARDAPGDAS
jgi:hypothetical protein